MLGSLIVQPIEMRSPRCATDRSQNRANLSTIAGDAQPPRAAIQRGVVKWWNVTTGATPCSWQSRARGGSSRARRRELAVFGLDPRPLDREAVGAEPEVAHERDVVGVAVVAVGAVARHLDARGVRRVLERPPVVVPVAALDLVRGGGHAPEEPSRESHVMGRSVDVGTACSDVHWR